MARLDFLDQFRGATMVCMVLVNFLGDGDFNATPAFFRHGGFYISFPDTVMPGFLFAAGLSYRISHMKTIAKSGKTAARFKILVPRALGLLICAYWLTGFGVPRLSWEELRNASTLQGIEWFFYGSFFSALTQIALTMLWCLLVIERSIKARIIFALASQWLYVLLELIIHWIMGGAESFGGYEGGFFGFLSWTFPLLAGSVCQELLADASCTLQMENKRPPEVSTDVTEMALLSVEQTSEEEGVAATDHVVDASIMPSRTSHRVVHRRQVRRVLYIVAVGIALMLLGYLLSFLSLAIPVVCYNYDSDELANCSSVGTPPVPFVRPGQQAMYVTMWSMIQCWPTFMLFTTGFQVVVCSAVYYVCDVKKKRLWGVHDMCDAFGRNTLIAYYFHFGARREIAGWMPVDAPGGIVFLGLIMCIGSLYLALFHLRQHSIFVSV
jgi:hypothetical protein